MRVLAQGEIATPLPRQSRTKLFSKVARLAKLILKRPTI